VTETVELVLDIEGMTCASCVGRVERALDHVPGVDAVAVNLATRTATVQGRLDGPDALVGAVAGAGYGARPHDDHRDPAEEERSWRRRLLVAVPCTVATLLFALGSPGSPWAVLAAWILATPVVFWAGAPFFVHAIRAARHGTTSMDTLVALGASAAYGYSVWQVLSAPAGTVPAAYFDTAAVIVTLILVGKTLEARARATAGDASRRLLERMPAHAVIEDDRGERRIALEDLRPGMRTVVYPGATIPADGVVLDGSSSVDLSLLTGESIPLDVGPGSEVVGASVNGYGRLLVFVSTVGGQTRFGAIVRALQAAQATKAPVQRLADRVSSVFVPVVLALAAATFVGWIVIGGATAAAALVHATAVVLIACPCALGLATPAAIVTGAGRAAELGVLLKSGAVVEAASRVDAVIVDKTGTVTEGAMALAGVRSLDTAGPDEVLGLAAAVEGGSEHPIARAVVAAAREQNVAVPRATDHRVTPGAGATARVGADTIEVRRPEEPSSAADAFVDQLAAEGATPFVVRRNGAPIGVVGVVDRIKPEAARAIARLRSLGVGVSMATGDRTATARTVARAVGIDEVTAEVDPAGKVEAVGRAARSGRGVAFVGDGLNDAPALAAASVGIAIGSGTDVALAAADVNLLGSSLTGVPVALEVCRRTDRIIRQNLFWAFAYNVVMIPLAVVGLIEPMWAAAAMAASSVSVVANALRLRRFVPRESP
jgi:heavy metal translocating P-type ATPase